jgi:hypothetical protein
MQVTCFADVITLKIPIKLSNLKASLKKNESGNNIPLLATLTPADR